MNTVKKIEVQDEEFLDTIRTCARCPKPKRIREMYLGDSGLLCSTCAGKCKTEEISATFTKREE